MKANMLALTISSLYEPRSILKTTGADISAISALRLRHADDVSIKETVDSRAMVKFICISGEIIELSPALYLKDGVVSRTIKTHEHTHTLEVVTDSSSGQVVATLKSILDSTGEVVKLDSSWRITYTSSFYTRPHKRRARSV